MMMSEDLRPWFPIGTARLRLREFRQSDFDDVHAYARDPEVAHFMDWGPNSEDETRAFMDRMFAQQAEWPRDSVNLGVEHVGDGRVIGSIRLAIGDREHLAGDIGYSFNSAYWRQGYCTEAARAMLDVGFRELGLHRIWAECNVENVGSWGVMEKLGMRREGHFRRYKQIKGEWRDGYLYAILADEWILPGQN
jgi:RimJ/RimL family protein N-acetyltransferase